MASRRYRAERKTSLDSSLLKTPFIENLSDSSRDIRVDTKLTEGE